MLDLHNFTLVTKKQTTFFKSNYTKVLTNRIHVLKQLLNVIEAKEKEIHKALYLDLKKPEFEALTSETLFVIKEIKLMIKKLRKWSKPRKVHSSLINFPSKDYIIPEPYGKVLIISPWNYPFQLAITPLIGAIAAGNTVVLKPSESSPHTSKIIIEILTEVFPETWVAVIEGDATVAKALLELQWDYIFFTGSTEVGKSIAKAAAKNLTPITLELGGKSPCVVDQSVPIEITAKRIVWGKFINCGQTCIAPDYVLVHHTIKQALVEAMVKEIESAFGKNIEESPDYGRIIHKSHYDKLMDSLVEQKLIYTGKSNEKLLFFHPTLVDEPPLDSALMKEEIFGPILPILSYTNETDIANTVLNFDKPLAFYIFSRRKKFIKQLHAEYSFGGGVVNDTLLQFANQNLPFGGVGSSGVGAYHGRFSFELFSHLKAVVKRSFRFDLPQRYAPYPKSLNLLKSILKKL